MQFFLVGGVTVSIVVWCLVSVIIVVWWLVCVILVLWCLVCVSIVVWWWDPPGGPVAIRASKS